MAQLAPLQQGRADEQCGPRPGQAIAVHVRSFGQTVGFSAIYPRASPRSGPAAAPRPAVFAPAAGPQGARASPARRVRRSAGHRPARGGPRVRSRRRHTVDCPARASPAHARATSSSGTPVSASRLTMVRCARTEKGRSPAPRSAQPRFNAPLGRSILHRDIPSAGRAGTRSPSGGIGRRSGLSRII